MTPFLLDDELAVLTHPMKQAAAQRRFLKRIGVPFVIRPDGRPLVSRDVVAQVLGAQPAAGPTKAAANDEPNEAALQARLNNRRRKHG